MARSRKFAQPDPEDVFVDALTHIPAEFLACREMGHQWRLSSPFRRVDSEREEGYQARGGFLVYAERKFTCQRCTKVRADTFSISTTPSGHTSLRKISGSYDDPEGYAIEGIGNTSGMRDLLYGVAFDASQQTTPRRTRRKAS